MRVLIPFAVGALILPATLAALISGLRADEAALADGKRAQGTLELDARGRLRFTSPNQPAVSGLREVSFSAKKISAWRPVAVHRVTFRTDQHLTGELIELGEKELKLRTAWADSLTIPRPAVASIMQIPGRATVLAEDFEAELRGWQRTGSPTQSDREKLSGKYSLALNALGQAAEYVLVETVETGRIDLSFHDPGSTTGARWTVETEWGQADNPRVVRVVVAGETKAYAVEAAQGPGEVKHVPRSAGWHELSLRFAPDYLLVGVDGRPLWSSGREGPGGPLHKLRLVCAASPGNGVASGEVCFDDVTVARAVDRLPHHVEDVAQDEVWLLPGDQLLGRVLRADRKRIELDAGRAAQTIPWSKARGLYLRREAVPPQTSEGEHVRLWLHAGDEGEPDELEGVLTALDARRLVLRHPLLGKREIERARLLRLRPLFHGRRIELDTAFHHLGDPDRSVPELQPARAEATSLRRTFRLDAVPAEARLVVDVVRLKGTGDGIGEALERGELRTEAIVNGQRVDYLNRHVGRSSPRPQRVSVALPRRCLQAGENVLELRQTPDRASERCESCGVCGIALELPR